MIRKFGIMTLAMFLTGTMLAGCSGKGSDKGKQESKENSTQTQEVSKDTKKEDTAAGKITVSAAASLTDVLNELANTFKKTHPDIEVSFTFGGSGALQTQIEEGAPVDLFFSAAKSNMDALEEKGLINTATRKDVLKNEIVLITPKGEKKATSFEDILANQPKIALGESQSVPAGKYAQEIFTKLGNWEEVKSHAVFASNVREVLAWVENGEADCGVVYATDAKSSDGVDVICNAPAGGPEVLYPAALVKDCANPKAAQAFLDFLTSREAGEAFTSYGFTFLAK